MIYLLHHIFQRTYRAAGFGNLFNKKARGEFEKMIMNMFQFHFDNLLETHFHCCFEINSLRFFFVFHLGLVGEASLFIKPFRVFSYLPAVFETPTLV